MTEAPLKLQFDDTYTRFASAFISEGFPLTFTTAQPKAPKSAGVYFQFSSQNALGLFEGTTTEKLLNEYIILSKVIAGNNIIYMDEIQSQALSNAFMHSLRKEPKRKRRF